MSEGTYQRVTNPVEEDLTGNNGGLTKKILRHGDKVYNDAEGNNRPTKGSKVVMHYTGHLGSESGPVFDSSHNRNKPFDFTLGVRQVILGWDKTVATMQKGEKVMCKISPDYGYGNSTVGPIPAGSTLYFEMELMGWKAPSEAGSGADNNEGLMTSFVLIFMAVMIFLYFW
jgi:FKBP-type peptidyl-prolyl cis-trans isomerase